MFNLEHYLEDKTLTHSDRVCTKKDLNDYIIRGKQAGIIPMTAEERDCISKGEIPPQWYSW
jgi:hypothetical protein